MASTRDFQEYASSGELIDMKIGGTANNNKVATFGDLPTNYVTDADLLDKFASGAYTQIFLGNNNPLSEAATKQYVQEEVVAKGNYTDESVKAYLSNSNNLTAIYIGSATFENKVATMSDLPTDSNYTDSDVVTLLASGSVPVVYVAGISGKLKLATEEFVDAYSDSMPIDVVPKYVADTLYTAISADRGKTIYMTSTSNKSVSLSTSVFAENVQMAVANLSNATIKFYTPGSATINGSTSDLLNAVPAYGVAYVTRCSSGFLVG